MSEESLHIALIQFNLAWEQPSQNRNKLEKLFQDIPLATDLVVLPEMFSTGFSMNIQKLAETMDGETIQWMKEKAKELNAVVSGSLMIQENAEFYNRFVFVFPNQSVEFYNKRHLFSMGEEHVHFTPGNGRKVIQIKSFLVLPQVCYDLRFPVFSRNRNDYDLLVNSANWPAPRQEVWNTLLKARAIENQSYVIGVNRVGQDGNGIRYSGESCVVDPKGKIMIISSGSKEQIVTSKLLKGSLDRFRKKFPVLPDADDFQLF